MHGPVRESSTPQVCEWSIPQVVAGYTVWASHSLLAEHHAAKLARIPEQPVSPPLRASLRLNSLVQFIAWEAPDDIKGTARTSVLAPIYPVSLSVCLLSRPVFMSVYPVALSVDQLIHLPLSLQCLSAQPPIRLCYVCPPSRPVFICPIAFCYTHIPNSPVFIPTQLLTMSNPLPSLCLQSACLYVCPVVLPSATPRWTKGRKKKTTFCHFVSDRCVVIGITFLYSGHYLAGNVKGCKRLSRSCLHFARHLKVRASKLPRIQKSVHRKLYATRSAPLAGLS